MSLRSLKWSLLLLCLLSFLVMWYLSLPVSVCNVIECVNWMYFYEYEPIHRQDFHFTLQEHSNCSHQNPFLVILVTSHPSDVKARQAIRALSLEDEHLLYGDIIRQDFLDTYSNLTLKTIMAFRWATEFCPNARYIMKTDTDVFVNTGNLVKYLLNLNHSEKFFTGFSLTDNYSYKGFYQKTHISYQEYPSKVFSPSCKHTNIFFLYRIHLDFCQLRHMIAASGFSSKEIITFWQIMLRNITCHY
ncbi:hypothetical protein FD755_022798 [Muntiacus reevesi]|uniref:Hexosyltransferase n=1 Tax=Muntiacus reevesi TaxID=9886 RepID=A0A5N3VYJ1_MUNRE|nr:hypothetical protein FD755_022798 [Muntiacus reevesi]